MKRSTVVLAFTLLFVLSACDQALPKVGTSADSSEYVTVTYEPSSQNFPNPERGLPMRQDPPWPKDADGDYVEFDDLPWDFCGSGNYAERYDYIKLTEALDADALRAGREAGATLMMNRYHLAAFRRGALSEGFLNRLDADFAAAREAGVKLVPRFAYNYPKGGPDAPLERVLGHLKQLGPVLRENEDVLAFMDFGFIGCWGEMHSSSNLLVERNGLLNEATRQLVKAVFDAVPESRMVAVRYPHHKFQYFNGAQGPGKDAPIQPVSEADAFGGSLRSRWAHHDDCIACGEWNAGTYENGSTLAQGSAEEVKVFLAQDNRFLVQSGELGAGCCELPEDPVDEDGDGWASDYAACDRVVPLFERLRYTTFNHLDDAERVQRWRDEGCYGEIATRLGYRYRLLKAQVPKQIQAGSWGNLSLEMTNDGFAGLYNPRGMELVFRHQKTGEAFVIDLAVDEEPRLWLPGPGETKTLEITANLPNELGPGTYSLFLNLPDPALKNRPEYSVRLANKGVWEKETGYNDLKVSVKVTQ